MMYFGVAFGTQSPPQEQIFNQHFPAAAPVPNLLLGQKDSPNRGLS
jgi:hypothetical protein